MKLHLRRTERNQLLEIPLTGNIVEAVAQHHGQHIFLFQKITYLKSDIQCGFGIMRPSGIQKMVSHLLAVHKQVKMSQSGHIHDGIFNFLVYIHPPAGKRQLVSTHHTVTGNGLHQRGMYTRI